MVVFWQQIGQERDKEKVNDLFSIQILIALRKELFQPVHWKSLKLQYIFLILTIFALDLATGLLAMIFQERLVANVRLRLVNKLKNEYGIQASFTAAIDYVSHLDKVFWGEIAQPYNWICEQKFVFQILQL